MKNDYVRELKELKAKIVLVAMSRIRLFTKEYLKDLQERTPSGMAVFILMKMCGMEFQGAIEKIEELIPIYEVEGEQNRIFIEMVRELDLKRENEIRSSHVNADV